MPLAHHDLVCHLKSTTHCTTCIVWILGGSRRRSGRAGAILAGRRRGDVGLGPQACPLPRRFAPSRVAPLPSRLIPFLHRIDRLHPATGFVHPTHGLEVSVVATRGCFWRARDVRRRRVPVCSGLCAGPACPRRRQRPASPSPRPPPAGYGGQPHPMRSSSARSSTGCARSSSRFATRTVRGSPRSRRSSAESGAAFGATPDRRRRAAASRRPAAPAGGRGAGGRGRRRRSAGSAAGVRRHHRDVEDLQSRTSP